MMQIVRSTVGDNYSLLIGGRIPSAILAYIPTPFLTRKGERGKGETRYPRVHNFHARNMCDHN